MANITHTDVENLLKNPSDKVRAQTAEKIASSFASQQFSNEEKEIATAIFQKMASDAALIVRKALSESLQYSGDFSHELAKQLAKDVEDVALPMLKNSQILTDQDLIEIIKESDEGKQVAIAQRKNVSTEISEALIDTENKNVVKTVIKNDSAHISIKSFNKVLDKFPDDPDIQKPLVERKKLPLSITEKLINVVSDSLKYELVNKHKISKQIVDDVIRNTRERAIVALANCDNLEDVEQLVKQLVNSQRLTTSLILRALCMGYLNFFEIGLAEIAKLPVKNIRILVHDSSGVGLKSVFKKAKISDSLYPYFKTALDIIEETVKEGFGDDIERYQEIVMERLLTQIGDQAGFGADNIDYLLSKLDNIHRPIAI